MNGTTHQLLVGEVTHQRLRPRRHQLRYRVYALLLDVDDVAALHQSSRFFSLGRFNLFSLHWRDYGDGDAAGPRPHVERQLQAAGMAPGGRIRLLTMPRILGYAFNPLSVYFCERPQGGLQAILYEVNNTFGQRHSYLLPATPDEGGEWIDQHCAKQFYVSPFLGMDLQYRFRIRPPAPEPQAARAVSVGVEVSDTQGPILAARLSAQPRALGDPALARVFLSHPLLTFKVIGAIHWEALRLWLKGVGLVARPAPPTHAVTVQTTPSCVDPRPPGTPPGNSP